MDDSSSRKEAAEKLRVALEMFGSGESVMREKLRRTFPAASQQEIERQNFGFGCRIPRERKMAMRSADGAILDE